jgi:hypothetical protein
MVVFSLTVAVLLSLSSSLYLFLSHMLPQIDEHFASEVAAIPFVAMHQISESFEKAFAKRTLKGRSDTVSYGKYLIPWPLMLVYGTVTLLAWGIGGAGIYDTAAQGDGISTEMLYSGLSTISLLVMVAVNSCGAFFVGKWIGIRCARRGLVVLFICFLSYAFLSSVVSSFSVPEETLSNIHVYSHIQLLIEKIVDIVVYYPIGLLGFWYGKQGRQGKYISYLLGIMPASARETLVDLACDEANRAREPSLPAPPTSAGEAIAAPTS